MRCKICNSKTYKRFNSIVLNKYSADYYYCDNCNFLFISNPFWLKEAYNNPINIEDTGIVLRNITLSKKLTTTLYVLFNKNSKFLDYAGGYGIFVRTMRDIGFNFYWADIYTENLFAKGFEYNDSMKIDAITTFESFEHFVDPMLEIENMFKISDTILFSTELLPKLVPSPNDWWYYGLTHGQHISFYSKKTFLYIAKRFDCYYYYINQIHILTKNKIPNYLIFILNLHKLKLYLLLNLLLKSKTFEDYKLMSTQK
jgi:hypothetical protein